MFFKGKWINYGIVILREILFFIERQIVHLFSHIKALLLKNRTSSGEGGVESWGWPVGAGKDYKIRDTHVSISFSKNTIYTENIKYTHMHIIARIYSP